jgi:hypothetical protein
MTRRERGSTLRYISLVAGTFQRKIERYDGGGSLVGLAA